MFGAWTRWRVVQAAALLAIPLHAVAASGEEKDVPDWVPSLGLGFGLQSREIDGTIDAVLYEGTVTPGTITMPCQTVPPAPPVESLPPFPGFCDASDQDTRSSDGASLDLSGQLLGPPLASLPLRPRPFVHGGFAFNYDSRTIAEAGLNSEAFEENFQEPDVHTRLRSNPESLWYVGGGVALQLPIEFTPVFVKLGAHYLEERVDATGSIDRGFALPDNQVDVQRTEHTESLKIGGAGPSLGLEAEIWRFGPVSLQFVADVLLTFPLSGSDTQFDLEEPVGNNDPPSCSTDPNAVPCSPPASFDYDADNVHWLGVASLRFGWVGY